ncbi:MAG: helix-turn-helix transcriptional regulator [Acidimicrobiia bacterium]
MTPGEIIQRRRAELGLTQAQLAERIGRTSSTVQRWERGVATPPKSLLPTLATALQVSERDLGVAFGRETAPPVEAVEATTSQPSGGAATEAAREGSASGAIAIEEQPTMAVPTSAPVASAPQAKRRSPMRRAPAVDSAEGLSYIERPQQRYRYLLRATLTVVVGIVLLFILFWAFGELRTAVGDVWDLFGDDAPPGTAPGTDF